MKSKSSRQVYYGDQQREKERGCAGKRAYKYRRLAQNAITDMIKRKRGTQNLEVYDCMYCDNFHVGNNKHKKLRKKNLPKKPKERYSGF